DHPRRRNGRPRPRNEACGLRALLPHRGRHRLRHGIRRVDLRRRIPSDKRIPHWAPAMGLILLVLVSGAACDRSVGPLALTGALSQSASTASRTGAAKTGPGGAEAPGWLGTGPGGQMAPFKSDKAVDADPGWARTTAAADVWTESAGSTAIETSL